MNELPGGKFDFETLATSIHSVHAELSRQASRAVNVSLTLRNWLIGYYIAEYELRGSDRAEYGEKVLQRLSERLTILAVESCDKRRLEQYLQFYRAYPQIARTASAQFQSISDQGLRENIPIARTAPAPFENRIAEQLSFSHFELLVRLDSSEKRAFYETHASPEAGRCGN